MGEGAFGLFGEFVLLDFAGLLVEGIHVDVGEELGADGEGGEGAGADFAVGDEGVGDGVAGEFVEAREFFDHLAEVGAGPAGVVEGVVGHFVGEDEAEGAVVAGAEAGVDDVVDEDDDFAGADAHGGGVEGGAFDDEDAGGVVHAQAAGEGFGTGVDFGELLGADFEAGAADLGHGAFGEGPFGEGGDEEDDEDDSAGEEGEESAEYDEENPGECDGGSGAGFDVLFGRDLDVGESEAE